MADPRTFDLFDGLPLDYTFLERGDNARMAGSMNVGGGNSAPNMASSSFMMPDDQMLLDSDVPSSSPTNMMAPKSESDDLLSPLSISFDPNGATAVGTNYRVALQHKHKRVRSNPDMLQEFGMTNVARSVITPPIMGTSGMVFSQPHNMISLGSVPLEPLTNLMHLVDPSTPQGFQEMDDFLKEMSWSELYSEQQQQQQQMPVSMTPANASGAPSIAKASPVAHRTQRIQHGVNELQMKRKRPVNHHSRHHSNPVDLLYNLDQFRVLAQQNKQQQKLAQVKQEPPQMVDFNAYSTFPASTNCLVLPQSNTQDFQFQVPLQIASGAVHSLHGRRSSLGSNLPPRAAARRRGANRSSGLSMDMSQINLNFLSVPEEASLVDISSPRSPPRRNASSPASSSGSKKISIDEMNRKMYKCGRCGQPKVGHICTMPDQRNNWTQVDLEVTKGLKIMRVNCHIMPVKSKWIVQCDYHEPSQLPSKGDDNSDVEIEAEPLGILASASLSSK